MFNMPEPLGASSPAVLKSGRALDGISFLDDVTRPKAPTIPAVTDAQRAQGRRLGLYHRQNLSELMKVRSALNRFLLGASTVAAVSNSIASMSMIENYRAFGNLCGSQCQFLEMHHTVEDRSIFPYLRNDPRLQPSIERLSAEHLTIHALIERLQDISRSIVINPTPDPIAALVEIYCYLERIVVSHFGYEERELEEALGYYNIQL